MLGGGSVADPPDDPVLQKRPRNTAAHLRPVAILRNQW